MFDTLKYVNILEEKGYSRDQAEATVTIMREVMKEELASKEDITGLKEGLSLLKQDVMVFKQDVMSFKQDVDHKFEKLENRLTIKLGGMLLIGLTAMSIVMKYITSH